MLNVYQAIHDIGITEAFSSFMHQKERSTNIDRDLIEALQEWIVFARTCTAAERRVIETMHLVILENADVWQFVLAGSRATDTVEAAYQTLLCAFHHLRDLADLIRSDAIRQSQEPRSKDPRLKGKEPITVIIMEEDDQFSTPQKLAQVLTSVADLYEVCLALNDPEIRSYTNGSLIVIACDSGSEKSFDLLGFATGIAGLKDIFHGLYDRIFFRREHQAGLQLDLIAKSLPIYEKLADLEKQGKMGPEQAELYRRKITNGTTQLVEARAMIPELEQRATAYDPRKLLGPDQKLLVGPTETRKSRRKKRPKRRIIIDED
jgi:hypothetical protein